MRVLHLIYDDPANPWLAGGGAVRVREIYRRLVPTLDVEVLTGAFPGHGDEDIVGIRYRRTGIRASYALSRASFAAAANLRVRRADFDAAVWDFSVYAPVWLPWPARVGATLHHLTGPTAPERWGPRVGRAIAALEVRLLRRARWIATPSAWTIDQLQPLAAPGTHLRLVGAGVDDALFELDRSERDYLLYFGRLDTFQKGLDTLLDGFALLAAERPEVRLRIAGRGKDGPWVARRIAELGLDSRVELLGAVSEAERRELFSGALLLLMPSRFEGFGMVAAEALAAGLPVVAAAAGSLPEVVGEGGGVLVPPSDAPALARATRALLADPAARDALSRAARAAAERYRWDSVAQRHLALLEEIAGRSESAGSPPPPSTPHRRS